MCPAGQGCIRILLVAMHARHVLTVAQGITLYLAPQKEMPNARSVQGFTSRTKRLILVNIVTIAVDEIPLLTLSASRQRYATQRALIQQVSEENLLMAFLEKGFPNKTTPAVEFQG